MNQKQFQKLSNSNCCGPFVNGVKGTISSSSCSGIESCLAGCDCLNKMCPPPNCCESWVVSVRLSPPGSECPCGPDTPVNYCVRYKRYTITELIFSDSVRGAGCGGSDDDGSVVPPTINGPVNYSTSAELSFEPCPNTISFSVNADTGQCVDEFEPSHSGGTSVLINISLCVGGCPYGTDYDVYISATYEYIITDDGGVIDL